MSWHSLKLQFYMFEHKGNMIVWIAIKVCVIFSINCKVYMLKVLHKSKMFLHVQNIQTSKMYCLFFFKPLFFLRNVHHCFWKLERTLTLMTKGLELMKIIFIIDLITSSSNVLLTLKIMDFENAGLIKVVHIYVIEGINA